MVGLVLIPDAMEEQMKADLDRLRDSLPEEERPIFEKERDMHRQSIINAYAETGRYPAIGGVIKNDQ